MITEIVIYNDGDTKRVTYKLGNEQPQLITDLSTTLQTGIDKLITYVTNLKTASEKTSIALEFIKANATDTQKLTMISIYPIWIIAKAYVVGDELRYMGNLYRVLQAHTSQNDWKPDVALSLFTKIVPPEVIAQWVQPIGGDGKYTIGAKVLFESKTYESIYAGINVWTPTALPTGWKLVL